MKLIFEGLPDLLPMDDRSKGVHVSGVIHKACLAMGHYEPDGEINMTRLQLGNALEHAIIHRFSLDDPERYMQPGEIVKDGIYGTPDLLDLKEKSVIEIKLTWMSSKHKATSEKFWRYWVQLKSYCKMLDLTKGQLHVCHINGNYKWGDPAGGPTYRVYEANFSAMELAENWSMIRTRALRYHKDEATDEQLRSLRGD